MNETLPLISINGVIGAQVSPLDRGFTYGDGMFETCRMINGEIPLWDLHSQRLVETAKKLFISVDMEELLRYRNQLIDAVPFECLENATIKIIISRGVGGRGYRLPSSSMPTILVGIFSGPSYPIGNYQQGVTAIVCKQRLGINTTLAGLKHLNRLENILARTEWQDESIAEGLLLNTNDHVIEATCSNIFIVKNEILYTPDLSASGVAGIMRRHLLESLAPRLHISTQIKQMTLSDLESADEVFLCNSLFGIWPVNRIHGLNCTNFPVGPVTCALQARLAQTTF